MSFQHIWSQMFSAVEKMSAKLCFSVVGFNSKLISKRTEVPIKNPRDSCDKRAYIHMCDGENLALL